MKHRPGRKNFVILIPLLVTCLLAGCGKDGPVTPEGATLAGGETGIKMPEPRWQYAAEKLEVETDSVICDSAKLVGENLYYYLYDDKTESKVCSMYRYALSDGSTEPLPINISNGGILAYDVGTDGAVYTFVSYKEAQGTEGEIGKLRIEKYDAKGSQVYSTDIEEQSGDNRFFKLTVDGEGRAYLYYNRKILCYDGQGNLSGSIDPSGSGAESTVTALCRGKDGEVYACVTRDVGNSSLVKFNFAGRTAEVIMESFVACAENGLSAGQEKDLLAQDGNMVYEFDLTAKTGETLLRWTDSGLSGNRIRAVGAAPEEKLLAVQGYGQDGNGGSIFLLSRLSEEEVPQKAEIVLATDALQHGRLPDTLLIESVAAFNNSNDHYFITIKEYGEDLTEARRSLDMELAAGKGPDIIYNSLLFRKESLAEQGALEDLGPWLEQSTVIGRDNYMDHTLESCAYDGKVMFLPKTFMLQTIIGRASDVGEDMGWTMDELMALPKKHPGTQLFAQMWLSKTYTLKTCLSMYMDHFVDWDAGKCSFDSPEFIKLLEFADRYGDVKAEGDETDEEKLLQGKILLKDMMIDNLELRQFYNEMLEGNACAVGYPTADGEPASILTTSKLCAITAASEHKEGAWAFLEYFATYPIEGFHGEYPAVKSCFEESLEKELEAKSEENFIIYAKDSNGKQILDEDGNPTILDRGISILYWGTTEASGYAVIHALTQEDVDWFLDILHAAKIPSQRETDIQNIIFEETNYLFDGNKSAQEVAEIIQNRVQLYLNEK